MANNRRKTLKLAGATATVAIAGCLDDIASDGGDSNGTETGDEIDDDDGSPNGEETDNDGDNDNGDERAVPEYTQWIAWHEDDVSSIYADIRADEKLDELTAAQPEIDAEHGLFEHDDPLLAVPGLGLFDVMAMAGLGLIETGLGDLVDSGAENDFETAIDELLFVNDAFLLLGAVDTDEITEILTQPTEDEFGVESSTVYEQTTEIGELSIYEMADGDEDGAVAVGDEAIIVGDGEESRKAVDVVREPIEAQNGDRERAVDVESAFAWGLETAGHGHVVVGDYGKTGSDQGGDDTDVLDGATGVIASLGIDDETDWNADMAVSGAELDDDAQAEIEDEFGAFASDVSHEFDGDRVTISASWDDDPTE